MGFIILAVTLVSAGVTWGQSAPEPVVLPPTLDNFYPPKAPAPVYLINMIQLATPFSGVASDLMQGDMENVGKTYEKFRTQYVAVSKMVPEWTSSFPMGPVDELGAALGGKDPSKVMAAMDKVGQVCNGCHIPAMAAAQQRYHWGTYDNIAATDPLSKQTVPFSVLMQMIDGSLSGIETDVEQGQIENARATALGLKARFGELKEVCAACHDSERKYYVDESVMGKIDQLQAALAANPVDPKAIGGLVQGIGFESCHKCHLVHNPAAYSKYRFSTAKAAH
ncbi:MAG: hypothetical protein HY851_08660 [candidate division Zixibacteria bacterium]|nr:hypothetical protein [candidate division Zixibacteria bacterium]